MGYGYYILADGREAGYAVYENCDSPGCVREIGRGLDNLCGKLPNIPNISTQHPMNEAGCKNYYCAEHQYNHECTNPACDVYPASRYDLVGPCALPKNHAGEHKTLDEETFTETEKEEYERYNQELV